jgi:hypothetical protein
MRIAILEDDERRTAAMRQVLRAAVSAAAVVFDNAPDMNAWLRSELDGLDLLCLDHDLGPNRARDGQTFDPGIGRDVVDYLITQPPACPVLIHSTNVPAANGMLFALLDAGWVTERVSPYNDMEWIAGIWRDRLLALLS